MTRSSQLTWELRNDKYDEQRENSARVWEARQREKSKTADNPKCPREDKSHSSNLLTESSAALNKGSLGWPKFSAGIKLLETYKRLPSVDLQMRRELGEYEKDRSEFTN